MGEVLLEFLLEVLHMHEEGGTLGSPNAGVFGGAGGGAEGDNEGAYEEVAQGPRQGEDVFVGEDFG
jgi:hypothetical protein